jgi:ABC-2 type transport system permease protein
VRILWAFLVRDLKLAASYRLQLFVQLAGVLTLSFTFFFIGRMMAGLEGQIPGLGRFGGSGYFGFALVGLGVSSYLDAALRSLSASLRQAQLAGTLEAMLATRAPLPLVVAGSSFYALLVATLRFCAFFALGVGVFQLPVAEGGWASALAVLALTVAVTLVLGVFAAGFVVRFKQGDPVTAGLAGLSWLVSGVLYPREILPPEIQSLAEALPMTHALEAMRLALLAGAPLEAFSGSVAYLALFAGLGAPVAGLWFWAAVRGAKRAGALGHY